MKWETQIPEPCAGVYVVAIADKIENCPFPGEEVSVAKLDDRKVEELRGHWLPEEVILYIGQTTKQTLAHRIDQFYDHVNGNPSSNHHGGHSVTLLKCDRYVYWARTRDPERAKRRCSNTSKRERVIAHLETCAVEGLG